MTYQGAAPRGLAGRPMFALLFAVAAGVLGFYLSAWTHWNGFVVFLIMAAVVGIVHFGWFWLEKPK